MSHVGPGWSPTWRTHSCVPCRDSSRHLLFTPQILLGFQGRSPWLYFAEPANLPRDFPEPFGAVKCVGGIVVSETIQIYVLSAGILHVLHHPAQHFLTVTAAVEPPIDREQVDISQRRVLVDRPA